jgi:hypothetical protein
MATQNLTQNPQARNGQTTIEQRPFLKVKTPCPTITRESRLVLPAGTIGRVVEYQRKQSHFIIDFGLLTVITLPVNSPLVGL